MGYRSDVEYTIRFKDEASYRLFILEAKANPATAGCFNDQESIGEFTCDDERWRIDFETSDVKWYESFPDVMMHEKLIAQAKAWCDDDTQKGIVNEPPSSPSFNYRLGYVLVRIGEDDDDVNRQSGGDTDYDWLYVFRSIESGSR